MSRRVRAGAERSIPFVCMCSFYTSTRREVNGGFLWFRYSNAQAKFAASFVLPLPLYLATCGYGHSGRVLSTCPLVECDATICAGFLPCSTHCSSTFTLSKVSVPGPPAQ